MKKFYYIIVSIMAMAIMCSLVGCSDSASDTDASVTSETAASDRMEAFAHSDPEDDTDMGLKVVKIDTAEAELTEDQKAVIEYFDTDYLNVFNYEAMRRYPQVFDGAQVNVQGTVLKVISMDSERYQLVLWMDVGSLDAAEWFPEEYQELYQGAYLLLSGETGEEWFMEGDILDVYGRSNGVESLSIDGTSYTLPEIDVQRAYQAQCDVRDGVIFSTSSEKFDLPFIKQVAHTIFGENIEIRKPVVGEDITEETNYIFQYLGMDITEERFVVELENQSNAKFTRFLFSKAGGVIQDIRDAMADFESGYERYIEFAADFQHFFLFTYDQELEMLTLEYYDASLNKIWKREFMETTSAQYDYTKNNIYLTANNELYIINTNTGEDTYPPAYVGSKAAIRKLTEGILMISNDKSDGVMMANLDGSIKWKTNLENDVESVEGLQALEDRIIFDYTWESEEGGFFETYVSLDRESGDVLVSATPSY